MGISFSFFETNLQNQGLLHGYELVGPREAFVDDQGMWQVGYSICRVVRNSSAGGVLVSRFLASTIITGVGN